MQPFSPTDFWVGTTLLAALVMGGFFLLDRRGAQRARAHEDSDEKRAKELLDGIKAAKALGSAAYGRYDLSERAIRDLYQKYRRHEVIIAADKGTEPEPPSDVEREFRSA